VWNITVIVIGLSRETLSIRSNSIISAPKQKTPFSFSRLLSRSFSFAVIGLAGLYTVQKFGLKFKPDYSEVESKIGKLNCASLPFVKILNHANAQQTKT
jgi:hypothetical protein